MITQDNHNDKLIYWQISAFLAIAFGIYARFIGLNTWSFATDEYFIAKSTDFILEKGVPQFDCGGYYMRGLLMQYFIAAERLLGVPIHLAVRLPSALSFFIALPALFILSRRLSGNTVAYACIILFSLSAWEIEFARFGRMYALFQAVFLWYLVFLFKAVIDDNRSSRYFMYSLTIVALFLWEGAIFLAMLNFLPAGLDYKKIKWQDLLVSGMIFIAVYLFLTTNFRHMGQIDPFPMDLDSEAPTTAESIDTPHSIFDNNTVWLLLALIPFSISVWGAFNVFKTKQLHGLIQAYLISIIVLSLAHLFGVIVYLTLIFLLYDPENFIKTIRLKWKLIGIVIIVSISFWLIYFSNSPGLLEILSIKGKFIFIIELVKALFAFPNVFDQFIFKWLPVMPFFFTLFSILFIFFLYFIIKNKNYTQHFDFRFLTIIIVTLIYIVGLVNTPAYSSRYLFFIYPSLLLMIVYLLQFTLTILRAEKYLNTALYISLISLMLISYDWNTNHIIHVSDYDVNFRIIYRNKHNFTKHYYSRRDKENVSNYINEHINSNDIVIITDVDFDYYLDKINYVYWDYNEKDFWGLSCDFGKRERWTNAPLIYKEKDLHALIQNTKGYVWLILLERRIAPDQINLRKKYTNFIVHRSPDKEFIIYKIPGGKNL